MCYTHKNIKKALNHVLVLEKVDIIIKLNQKACLKPSIEMNTELGRRAKNDFEKDC